QVISQLVISRKSVAATDFHRTEQLLSEPGFTGNNPRRTDRTEVSKPLIRPEPAPAVAPAGKAQQVAVMQVVMEPPIHCCVPVLPVTIAADGYGRCQADAFHQGFLGITARVMRQCGSFLFRYRRTQQG